MLTGVCSILHDVIITKVPGCASTQALALDGVDVSGPLFKNSTGGHDYIVYGQHDDAPNVFTPFDDAIRDADGWKLIQGTGGRLVNVPIRPYTRTRARALQRWSAQRTSTRVVTPRGILTHPIQYSPEASQGARLLPQEMFIRRTCNLHPYDNVTTSYTNNGFSITLFCIVFFNNQNTGLLTGAAALQI